VIRQRKKQQWLGARYFRAQIGR